MTWLVFHVSADRPLLTFVQAWAAIVASPGLRSHLTRLCLGIAFDPDSPRRRHTPAFQMPSLAPLAHLQARPRAAAAAGWLAYFRHEGKDAVKFAYAQLWIVPPLPWHRSWRLPMQTGLGRTTHLDGQTWRAAGTWRCAKLAPQHGCRPGCATCVRRARLCCCLVWTTRTHSCPPAR